MIDSREPY